MVKKKKSSIERTIAFLRRLTKEEQETFEKVVYGAVLVSESRRDKPAS